MKEEKVYVDELPKSCVGCKYFAEHRRQCNLELCLQWNEVKFKFNDCPLIDIKTHDRELVKEVCEKISTELENETETYCEIRQCSSPHYQGDYVWFNYVKFGIFIAQIQKEFEK